MHFHGPEVYDDPEFSRRYLAKRRKIDNPNDTLEKPVVLDMLADISGKHFLDLGCGDGAFGRELLEAGATHYYGVDGSETMIELARQTLRKQNAELARADLAEWVFPKRTFDIVLSRLVLHYLESLDELFERIYQHLSLTGNFIFSVEHPVITSCYDSYNHVQGKRGNWVVDNYFDNGPRENIWIDKKVIKYHKTIETYFQICQKAGFRVESIRESNPQIEHFQQPEHFERRKRIPLFLFFKLSRQ